MKSDILHLDDINNPLDITLGLGIVAMASLATAYYFWSESGSSSALLNEKAVALEEMETALDDKVKELQIVKNSLADVNEKLSSASSTNGQKLPQGQNLLTRTNVLIKAEAKLTEDLAALSKESEQVESLKQTAETEAQELVSWRQELSNKAATLVKDQQALEEQQLKDQQTLNEQQQNLQQQSDALGSQREAKEQTLKEQQQSLKVNQKELQAKQAMLRLDQGVNQAEKEKQEETAESLKGREETLEAGKKEIAAKQQQLKIGMADLGKEKEEFGKGITALDEREQQIKQGEVSFSKEKDEFSAEQKTFGAEKELFEAKNNELKVGLENLTSDKEHLTQEKEKLKTRQGKFNIKRTKFEEGEAIFYHQTSQLDIVTASNTAVQQKLNEREENLKKSETELTGKIAEVEQRVKILQRNDSLMNFDFEQAFEKNSDRYRTKVDYYSDYVKEFIGNDCFAVVETLAGAAWENQPDQTEFKGAEALEVHLEFLQTVHRILHEFIKLQKNDDGSYFWTSKGKSQLFVLANYMNTEVSASLKEHLLTAKQASIAADSNGKDLDEVEAFKTESSLSDQYIAANLPSGKLPEYKPFIDLLSGLRAHKFEEKTKIVESFEADQEDGTKETRTIANIWGAMFRSGYVLPIDPALADNFLRLDEEIVSSLAPTAEMR